MELPKAYDSKQYEDSIYAQWESSGAFLPKKKKGAKPFTIAMPPPNATGTLHLGHAVMLALEDIMVRYHRMKGDSTLWIPGTDHASIATQNKVEKLIAEKGLTRHDLGREEFLKRVNEFVAGSQDTIRNQVRRMGSSCDWTRERYTLDPNLSLAVREVFARMYNDDLIYRGNRIVNWCPRCASTLADDEVDYKEERAKFYYLKYGPFVIGTARPETKFLDKVIVVHPKDKRYKKYVGKEMTVPWIEGDVKARIIADESADMNFGTGAMTITPAHDFTDFEIAKRHKLDVVKIIDEKGNLTEHAGSFAGKNAHDSRDAIIAQLESKGLVDRIDENYVHNISLCYRCGTVVEPLVSKQWFIAVDKAFKKGGKKTTLKKMSIDVVKKGEIKILPDRFNKTYFHWMENLHDWCISRQIWFGHQIPVWYCIGDAVYGRACTLECRNPIVSVKAPTKCPHCGSKNIRQDPDTLDTWFSAGLWTFSTLGWPKKTDDLKFFHPTSVLETGYDILFFWVARMILLTTYALGEVPFKTVYLHGLVRTRDGKKMSKSDPKTCIDPLDMIKKYGADALRLSMVIGSGPGNDTRLYEEKIAGFRNFVNKIWNAARFALLQREAARTNDVLESKMGKKSTERSAKKVKTQITARTLSDKWILTRTQEVITEVTKAIENYQFSEAGMKIYDFAWDEYCSWYLEMSKGSHQNLEIIEYVLETILQMLHPFVPFVTEAIWKHLGKPSMLISQSWPIVNKKFIFNSDAAQMSTVIDVISSIRNLRHESGINPAEKIPAVLVTKKWTKLLREKEEEIIRIARLSKLEIHDEAQKIHPALKAVTNAGVEIILPVSEFLDIASETSRLNKEKQNLENYIKVLDGKLKNKKFTTNAPAQIIEQEREKQNQAKERLSTLLKQIAGLKNG